MGSRVFSLLLIQCTLLDQRRGLSRSASGGEKASWSVRSRCDILYPNATGHQLDRAKQWPGCLD